MEKLKFYATKSFFLIILGNIYLLLGCICSSFLATHVCKDYDTKKSKFRNLCQLLYEIGLVIITVYFIRRSIKRLIPKGLKGLHGFDPMRVKELSGGVLLAFSFLMYMKDSIKSKVDVLYNFFDKSTATLPWF